MVIKKPGTVRIEDPDTWIRVDGAALSFANTLDLSAIATQIAPDITMTEAGVKANPLPEAGIITKAGILPFFIGPDGERIYGMASPKPEIKDDAIQPDGSYGFIPFGLPKGTKQYRFDNQSGHKQSHPRYNPDLVQEGEWFDIRLTHSKDGHSRRDPLSDFPNLVAEMETHLGTAIHECREETGLDAEDFNKLYYIGPVWRGNKWIVMYAGEVDREKCTQSSDESVRIAWGAMQDWQQAVDHQYANPNILPVLSVIEGSLNRHEGREAPAASSGSLNGETCPLVRDIQSYLDRNRLTLITYHLESLG